MGWCVGADNLTTLYEALEEALLTKNNLFYLQRLLFPPHSTTNNLFRILICNQDFQVLDIEYLSDGAFINDSNSNHYERNSTCVEYRYPCEGGADAFIVSSSYSKYSLISYIMQLSDIIRNVDEAFFELFTHLLGPSLFVNDDQLLYGHYSKIPTTNISLVVKTLLNNPHESDLESVLSLLLSWVRFCVCSMCMIYVCVCVCVCVFVCVCVYICVCMCIIFMHFTSCE